MLGLYLLSSVHPVLSQELIKLFNKSLPSSAIKLDFLSLNFLQQILPLVLLSVSHRV